MTSMRMRLVFSVSFVVSYVSHVASVFTVFLSTLDFFAHASRLAFVFQLCSGVGGDGVGG